MSKPAGRFIVVPAHYLLCVKTDVVPVDVSNCEKSDFVLIGLFPFFFAGDVGPRFPRTVPRSGSVPSCRGQPMDIGSLHSQGYNSDTYPYHCPNEANHAAMLASSVDRYHHGQLMLLPSPTLSSHTRNPHDQMMVYFFFCHYYYFIQSPLENYEKSVMCGMETPRFSRKCS